MKKLILSLTVSCLMTTAIWAMDVPRQKNLENLGKALTELKKLDEEIQGTERFLQQNREEPKEAPQGKVIISDIGSIMRSNLRNFYQLKTRGFLSVEGLLFSLDRYDEHIQYCEKLFKLDAQYGTCNIADPYVLQRIPDIARRLFCLRSRLAESYYKTGRQDEAFNQFRALFNMDYEPMISFLGIDNLNAVRRLGELPFDQLCPESRQIASVQSLLDLKRLLDFLAQNSPVQKKKQGKAKKSGSSHQKKTPAESPGTIAMRGIIKAERAAFDALCKKAQLLDFKKICQQQETYQLDEDLITRMKGCVESIWVLHGQSKNLKSKELSEQTREILGIRDQLKACHEDLKRLSFEFHRLVRVAIRKGRAPRGLVSDSSPKERENLKREVMEAHGGMAVKAKTHGEADPAYTQPEKDPAVLDSIEEINGIISFRGDTDRIFESQFADIYPPRTVDLLNVLNQSKNIGQLRQNLEFYDADLKKLEGKEKGLWSIRINEQYRIRFKCVELGGFIDVEVDDFH